VAKHHIENNEMNANLEEVLAALVKNHLIE